MTFQIFQWLDVTLGRRPWKYAFEKQKSTSASNQAGAPDRVGYSDIECTGYTDASYDSKSYSPETEAPQLYLSACPQLKTQHTTQ